MPVRPHALPLVAGVALALTAPAPADAAEVTVRHLDRRPDGWCVAETANFRILHQDDADLAERAGRVAEGTRTAVLRKWFGAAGEDWPERCEVYLHASPGSFWRVTGLSPGVPAATSVHAEGERVLWRRIDVHCEDRNVLAAVLPHEVTHAVLAGRFGGHAVPRWADEGMAVLSEPRDRVEGHLAHLARFYREGRVFSPRDLLRLTDYPAPQDWGVFYAESVSLVDFLARAQGPRTFTRFLRDGLRDGYEAALRRHYGWDFDDLEQHWRGRASGGGDGPVGSSAAGR